MNNMPEKIYVNDNSTMAVFVEDEREDSDTEYIRADLVPKQIDMSDEAMRRSFIDFENLDHINGSLHYKEFCVAWKYIREQMK